jgi:hypothetical protein
MKIHFTKKEYRLLLDYIAIGQWVMHAYDTSDGEPATEYDQLEQKILALAKDFGWENLVQHDSSAKKYYPTREYEMAEEVTTFLEEYDGEVFWDELCSRLASRDLLREKGREALEKMEFTEQLSLEDEISEKYSEEFVKNGLKNLVLIEKP